MSARFSIKISDINYSKYMGYQLEFANEFYSSSCLRSFIRAHVCAHENFVYPFVTVNFKGNVWQVCSLLLRRLGMKLPSIKGNVRQFNSVVVSLKNVHTTQLDNEIT